MGTEELTWVEAQATEALSLPAFPINLTEIRNAVKELLGETRRYGFFDEYTTHSFEHVLGMLHTSEWIIPQTTKAEFTPADWLMLVLSIYFHDLGLLISRNEFKKRAENNEFKRYLDEFVWSDDETTDYEAKLRKLSTEQRDRFLYQEFVRNSHGLRVRSWLEGVPLDDNNAAAEIRKQIHSLVGKLDPTIRRDLALICESHTLDDIDDVGKYRVDRPYGGPLETVNVQYIAAILRTVDLLQITRERAPSILFQLIEPTDPMSQLEWLKQGAVRAVRPKPGRDRDGRASATVQANTIEVHARFEHSDGFFALNSYLRYAERQLTATHAAIKRSERLLTRQYIFPWRFIDDAGIEAAGFLTETFGFEIDQHKILDLLTGHTLYNDTSVVLRELVQNSIDAVRLQAEVDGVSSSDVGIVQIHWDSQRRRLSITDNGTGMSQAIIENHLLKVGSSRYQDPRFQDKFPGFSSISRFGIGVLSAFMIADSVEITTCSEDDDKARRLSLRSVHGKYLIKLLDKVANRGDIPFFPHGTQVSLSLRPRAKIEDVLRTARTWILFPRCKVSVTVDDMQPVEVGFDSPKSALESFLRQHPAMSRRFESYSVKELSDGDVTIAYALARDELYQDWTFVDLPEQRLLGQEVPVLAPVGICVEGIAVDFNTPGFRKKSILAVANAVGKGAPKTNVARSAIEDTEEFRDMLRVLYGLYTRHVAEEIARISASDRYSLTWAIYQSPYIARALTNPKAQVVDPGLLQDSIATLPVLLVEREGKRETLSLNELIGLGRFVTVESPLSRSVEFFVRESHSELSAHDILRSLGDLDAYPEGDVLCNLGRFNYVESLVASRFDISQVSANVTDRRLTMEWRLHDQGRRWISGEDIFDNISLVDFSFWDVLVNDNELGRFATSSRGSKFSIPLTDVPMTGLQDFGAFVWAGDKYFMPSQTLVPFLRELLNDFDQSYKELAACIRVLELSMSYNWVWANMSSQQIETILMNNRQSHLREHLVHIGSFVEAIRGSDHRVFNPYAWERRDKAPG